MRIFVYEYTCASSRITATSLHAEGAAMLQAVVEDFARVSGVEVATLLHEQSDEETQFRRLAREADWTLVIAPEFDDILATRCQWVAGAGGRLLGPSVTAARLCADKRALGEHLRSYGIPTPRCYPASDRSCPLPAPSPRPSPPGGEGRVRGPAVCKPRYGAGSQATFLIRHPDDIDRALAAAQSELPGEFLLQPFVPGIAASVAFLIGPKQTIKLLPAAQHLSDDGRFRYLGGSIPLPPELAERATRVGRRAVDAVAGLQGYVGVDLVLGDTSDGGADYVIEINPRLTTSYLGLRELADTNLAEALLQVVQKTPLRPLMWRCATARYCADGSVTPAK